MADQLATCSQQGADDPRSRRAEMRARLVTGDPSFDVVLGGGIPRDSLYILSGPPGAGKTVLAQQIAFATAKAGMRVIYFTNVSEPHSKLIEHISGFSFYDPNLIGTRIQIYNITSQIRSKGLRETLDFIVDTIRNEHADLLVVDSFRGLKHVLDVGVHERGTIFDMAAQLSILGCTTLLVGEYTPHEQLTDPEFSTADGIISLWHAYEGLQERRAIRIIKMRGVSYLGGEHSFEICSDGIRVYPRQEALSRAPTYRAIEERVSTGINDLDEMIGGGVVRSSSTLLAGAPGTGKTLLALHFLAAGAAHGERGLMISFQENPEQLCARATPFGIGEQLGNGGATEIISLSPVELDLDAAAARIRASVDQNHVQRVVIDSVAELEVAALDPERFDDFLASLVGYLRSRDVTTVMTREIGQLFGADFTISSRGLSYIVDNIVLLRYIEVQASIRRALAVLKQRGSNHDKDVRELEINQGKIKVGARFDGLVGVLTGVPQATAIHQNGNAEEERA